MVGQEEIERIIEATDIVALVSEYVQLEKTGKNYRGLCPFHNEKTPSFSVSPEKKIAKCMGCGKGGNPITFLKEIKNISFNEALAELANKVGIKINIRLAPKKTNDYAKYYQITKIAQNFYSHNLLATKSGELAIDYLHKRGIDDETIKLFDIGLSSNKIDVLYNVLKDSNVLELDMMDLGLVRKSEKGYYDLFSRRIMFSIKDEEGNVVGFSGRIYQLDKDSEQPKYVNSPETIIFKKGQVLYNLNNAAMEIRKKGRVILHEGFMDVIASVRSGNKECVCSMGTALTIEQARLLHKYSNHAIICYDGDKAGIKASLKAIDILINIGMQVHLVLLPDGMDPDEYVKKYGQEEYLKYFEAHMVDPIEYQYMNALKNRNLKDFSEMEEVKQLVFKAINVTNSQTLIETYLKRLSDDLSVSYASLVMDYSTYNNKPGMLKNGEDSFVTQKKINIIENFENQVKYLRCPIRVLNYAKKDKEKALYIDSKLKIEGLEDKHQLLWIKLINSYYEFYTDFNEEQYFSSLDENSQIVYRHDMESIRRLQISDEYNDADLEACILAIEEKSYHNEIASNNIKLITASLEEQKRLIEETINRRRIIEKIKERK